MKPYLHTPYTLLATYQAPQIGLSDIQCEQGFAATGTIENVTEDPTEILW